MSINRTTFRGEPNMRPEQIYPILLAQLLLVAGCAQVQWTRPGTEPAVVKLDLEQCQQLARLDAARDPIRGTSALPKVEVDPTGLPSFTQPQFQSNRMLQEPDLANSCMRRKGYRTEPAQPDHGR